MLGDFKTDARTRNEFLHLVRSAPLSHVGSSSGFGLSESVGHKGSRIFESDGVHLERTSEGSQLFDKMLGGHQPNTLRPLTTPHRTMGQALSEGAGAQDLPPPLAPRDPASTSAHSKPAAYSKGVHYSTLELGKEDMKFSAAHYTVFSATERERLHGHTHVVRVQLTGPVAADGMIANYALFKSRVRELCKKYDETYLVPANSPHIKVEFVEGASDAGKVRITHNGLSQELPADDVRVLPVANVTLEELSMLLLHEVVGEAPAGEGSWADSHQIIAVTVKVSSDGGRGQWASTSWSMERGFGCPVY